MDSYRFSWKTLEEGKKFIEGKYSNKMKYGPNIKDKSSNVIELKEGDIVKKDKDGNLSVIS